MNGLNDSEFRLTQRYRERLTRCSALRVLLECSLLVRPDRDYVPRMQGIAFKYSYIARILIFSNGLTGTYH
jgi:hypothetical protein